MGYFHPIDRHTALVVLEMLRDSFNEAARESIYPTSESLTYREIDTIIGRAIENVAKLESKRT